MTTAILMTDSENKIQKKGGNASLKTKIGDNFAQDKIECNVVKLNL